MGFIDIFTNKTNNYGNFLIRIGKSGYFNFGFILLEFLKNDFFNKKSFIKYKKLTDVKPE